MKTLSPGFVLWVEHSCAMCIAKHWVNAIDPQCGLHAQISKPTHCIWLKHFLPIQFPKRSNWPEIVIGANVNEAQQQWRWWPSGWAGWPHISVEIPPCLLFNETSHVFAAPRLNNNQKKGESVSVGPQGGHLTNAHWQSINQAATVCRFQSEQWRCPKLLLKRVLPAGPKLRFQLKRNLSVVQRFLPPPATTSGSTRGGGALER